MTETRRELFRHLAAAGGGILLLGQTGFGQDKKDVSSQQSVKAATIADIVALMENEEFDIHALYSALNATSRLKVKNLDSVTVHVRVSKACGAGQDGYWEIPPGQSEPWSRCVYHRVTIKASYDRANDFDSVDHTMMVTTACNVFHINGGRFEYAGPDSCL